jgi:glucose-6-phosphate 1-dehydrogenase
VAAAAEHAAVFVLFGGTGDLARRMILPALRHLHATDAATRVHVIGVARADEDDDSIRVMAVEALMDAGIKATPAKAWARKFLSYHPIGEGKPEDYQSLGAAIEAVEAEHNLPGNRVFYLALPPPAFGPTAKGLAAVGLARGQGYSRLVVEKPFGRDLESARALNRVLHEGWTEEQIYRIDHYLGKETVQNLMVFRFANAMFEAVWNRDHVSSVQITVAESLGIEDRAGYYDKAGVVRDMIQNHLTQLVTLVAMEPPSSVSASAIRQEKVKALRSIAAIDVDEVVRGRYTAGKVDGRKVKGYLDEKDVPNRSRTATFAALRLDVDTWRWKGVPFLLRTGKRMARRLTEIVLTFREPPVSLFQPYDACHLTSDTLVLRVQPDEGFSLYFDVKTPGPSFALSRAPLRFNYADAFGPLPTAYETLLLDVLEGDQTLFVHADEVEASWELYTPLLELDTPVRRYPAGSWGPEEANALAGMGALGWRNP